MWALYHRYQLRWDKIHIEVNIEQNVFFSFFFVTFDKMEMSKKRMIPIHPSDPSLQSMRAHFLWA